MHILLKQKINKRQNYAEKFLMNVLEVALENITTLTSVAIWRNCTSLCQKCHTCWDINSYFLQQRAVCSTNFVFLHGQWVFFSHFRSLIAMKCPPSRAHIHTHEHKAHDSQGWLIVPTSLFSLNPVIPERERERCSGWWLTGRDFINFNNLPSGLDSWTMQIIAGCDVFPVL